MQRSFVLLLAIVVGGLVAGYHWTERSSHAEGSACACAGTEQAVVTVYAVVDLMRAGTTEASLRERIERQLVSEGAPCGSFDTRPGALVVEGPPCFQARVQAVLASVAAVRAP